MAKFLKLMRVKQETLQNNMLYMKVKKAAQLWHLRTETTKYMRRKAQDMATQYKLIRLRRCFDAIKTKLRLEKKGGRKFAQVLERMQLLDSASMFQKWQQYTIAEREKERRSKRHGSQTLGLILDRLVKRRLATTLHSLRNRTQKKDFKTNYLKRMLQHCATYRARYYFNRWHHQKECEKIAETVNVSFSCVITQLDRG